MSRPGRKLADALLLSCLAPVLPAVAQAPPAWTRGAVCYEVFVRSFFDSDGDGVGDLNGLAARLDYINDANPASTTDLGASCIWLMPVAASPSYHGYDVSDYYRVQPAYGTNEDFKRLVEQAHRRGIRVLVDMVLNHASSEHPSFQAALRDTTSPYRAWYRFSPTQLGKGPWGAEAWHRSPVRDEYYYGVFWKGMPDLNYETPAVREEAKKVATFWLREMGVDGFRLDAVPYLTEEGSCLKDCAGTHAFLREYATHLHHRARCLHGWGGVGQPRQNHSLLSRPAHLVLRLRSGRLPDLRGQPRERGGTPRWIPALSGNPAGVPLVSLSQQSRRYPEHDSAGR